MDAWEVRWSQGASRCWSRLLHQPAANVHHLVLNYSNTVPSRQNSLRDAFAAALPIFYCAQTGWLSLTTGSTPPWTLDIPRPKAGPNSSPSQSNSHLLWVLLEDIVFFPLTPAKRLCPLNRALSPSSTINPRARPQPIVVHVVDSPTLACSAKAGLALVFVFEFGGAGEVPDSSRYAALATGSRSESISQIFRTSLPLLADVIPSDSHPPPSSPNFRPSGWSRDQARDNPEDCDHVPRRRLLPLTHGALIARACFPGRPLSTGDGPRNRAWDDTKTHLTTVLNRKAPLRLRGDISRVVRQTEPLHCRGGDAPLLPPRPIALFAPPEWPLARFISTSFIRRPIRG
uniref:Uncharacterized protein n=1 Tax=Mycena chlorophos TaxID=658473 RepID=A0ABQ0L7H2_MYCCL|nr:predicted protein [Mycena chlorophos]